MEATRGWDTVELMVLAQPSGRDLRVKKTHLSCPKEAGMRRALGIPKGTFRHYRRPVRGQSCLHVREYSDRYEVHWDRHDPRRHPLRHWWADVRGGKATLLTILGALAGSVWVVL